MLLHVILLLLGSLAIAESVRPCSTSLIEGVTMKEVEILHDSTGQLHVTCASDLFYISTKRDNEDYLYDSLTCDESKGWIGEAYNMWLYGVNKTEKIADASSPVTISCADLSHCDISRIKGLNDDKNVSTVPSHTARHLKCPASNHLMGILVKEGRDEDRFANMKCGRDEGWSAHNRFGNYSAHRNLGKSISSELTISCFEYCTVIWEAGLKTDFSRGRDMKLFSCADREHKLFFNGAPVGDTEIGCSISDGWRPFNPYDHTPGASPFKLQHVECKSDPTQGGKRSVRAMRIAEGKQEE